jgi:hypothetical protein
MASWIKCTSEDGAHLRVNMDHVAVIRPHRRDRGFAGNELIFAAGNLSSVMVVEDEDYLTDSLSIKREHDQV